LGLNPARRKKSLRHKNKKGDSSGAIREDEGARGPRPQQTANEKNVNREYYIKARGSHHLKHMKAMMH
jgi:hypothetical protein